MTFHLTRVDKVKFLNGEMSGVEFLVGGNPLDHGMWGTLGRNFLSTADTEYDLAHGVVRLVVPSDDCAKGNLAYWSTGLPVTVMPLEPARDRDTSVRVPVVVNGQKIYAIMDTGAPETSIALEAAHRAGIRDTDMKPAGAVRGAGAGQAKSWTAPVASLQLGDEHIDHNWLRITDTDLREGEALIGVDYFLSHRIYVARSQGRVYATWNGGQVFVRNAMGETPAASGAAAPASAASDPRNP